LAIEFNCSQCGRLLTTSEARAGARAKCPSCDTLITVPARAPAPASASALAGGVPSEALAATAAWSADETPLTSAHPAATTHPGTAESMVSMIPLEPVESAVPLPAGAPISAPSAEPAPSRVCPNCRTSVDANSAYCSYCGLPLATLAPAPRYAPFWRRSAAALIDLIIVGVAADALQVLLHNRTVVAEDVTPLLLFLYFSLFECSSEQATLGKRIMRIIVCGSDGRRLTFPRSAIRTLAKGLSLLICGVGFLMPLLTPWKQALHDKLTDTLVVEK
jgi:uncharacterized RDD family membrane protein YckC/phage FluMu protein Com